MPKITKTSYPEQFEIVYTGLKNSPFSLNEKDRVAKFMIEHNIILDVDGYIASEKTCDFIDKMKLIHKYFTKISITSLCEIAFDFKIVKKYFTNITLHKKHISLSDKDIVIITFFLIQERHLRSGLAKMDMEKFVSRYYFYKYNNMKLSCIEICFKARVKI